MHRNSRWRRGLMRLPSFPFLLLPALPFAPLTGLAVRRGRIRGGTRSLGAVVLRRIARGRVFRRTGLLRFVLRLAVFASRGRGLATFRRIGCRRVAALATFTALAPATLAFAAIALEDTLAIRDLNAHAV